MSAPPFVTAGWLAEHLGEPDLVVVDGSWYLPAMNRDADAEYLAGHVPGAVRIDIEKVRDTASALPHMLPAPAEFAAAMGELGIAEDMTIVVYDGAGLFSAPRVWWMLTVFGAQQVRILDGGLPAWVAAGQRTETGEQRPRPARTFTARLDPAAVADLAGVRHALDTGSAQVVDARPADRFSGAVPEPRPGLRPGHLAGSLNLPFSGLVENGRLADVATIAAAARSAGIEPDRPVITSCGSGVTAAVLWLALDAIGQRPTAIYDGSYAEWGALDDTPIATGDR